ncbi:heavy metal-binding protein HIP-like [Ruditapes philippinarum]|uniref:heavy metal-binding protein HIP-like n=1 Tax=Ruditapes philippinarum TaxID=129788 RepID=UPI00295AE6E6|nr:heavy metal-binding protein HIP-like [Ruditapes philippinarum]
MMVRAILCVDLVVFLSFLAFLSPSRADGGSETCQVSKEKQLLEEMIRTQVKVEAMLQEIRKTEEHVVSVLEYRKQDVQKSLEDLKEDQANQKNELDKLKLENADLQQKIQSVQESTYRVPIVFFAARGMKSSYLTNGQTIIFPTTLNNLGSGYNNGTGVFTAPVSGLYQFSVRLCLLQDQYVYVAIVSENDVIMKTRLIDEGATHNACSSVSGLAILKRGGNVWVKSSSSSDGNNVWVRPTSVWNTFSGALINESY